MRRGGDRMSRATLVIMAAGIGSRFGGGIKQLEPVGPGGEIIMDYSIYDAMRAGFDKVIFVIRKDLEADFKEVIGNRISKVIDVEYAYQELDDIPVKYQDIYKDRKKPWGTGQAILVCKELIHTPFLVINADDYYGAEAYRIAYEELTKSNNLNQDNEEKLDISMVGFILKNTLSENGGVTRGVCKVDDQGYLSEIVETRNIEQSESGAVINTESGLVLIDEQSPVSMNMWGLIPKFIKVLEKGFETFLGTLEEDELKEEYLLPTIIGELLADDKISVRVLQSTDKWFGVTYKEDKEGVVKAVQELVESGMYPEVLFQ